MNSILFLARYPQPSDMKDGMMQRIANIDRHFHHIDRTYLYISLTKNFSYSESQFQELTIVKANIFIHFFAISKLLKNFKHIYIHSLWNYLPVSIFSFTGKQLILDVHGVVPQELFFYKKNILGKLFTLLETRLTKKLSIVLYVNHTMEKYFLDKYKWLHNAKNIVYPILSKNVFMTNDEYKPEEFKKELGILATDVVFIYSGNIQKWQNFDLTIESINQLNNKQFKFIILTNEVTEVNRIISQKLTSEKRKKIIVDSVTPDLLYKYYSIASYGYILRDDHILNRVAAPTKLIEYLYYGIIPIVKLVDIGDFKMLGYEYLSIEKVKDDLCSVKSTINHNIIKRYLDNSYDLQQLIFQ